MEEELFEQLVEVRKHIHQNPELSGKEKKTSQYLHDKLEELEPDDLIRFRNYGLVARFKGGNGKKVLVRGDFDALPIQEQNDFEHKSNVDNVSHKCGHDGHATLLLGLCHLVKKEELKGDVFALFQPSEENGQGAIDMIKSRKFKKVKADFAIALHNLPGYPLHQVLCKKGTFTAAANSMILTFRGKTSHAAEPERGKNPARAMAETTRLFLDESNPDLGSSDFGIITPVYTTMGEKSYGVSAGYGELHFTLRAWDNNVMEKLEHKLCEIVQYIGDKFDIQIDIDWVEQFYANSNSETVFKAIRSAANNLQLDFREMEFPFKWGEDFGAFTEKLDGGMFCLGAGEKHPALHNPDYDFPDDLIKTGPNMFLEIIKSLQS